MHEDQLTHAHERIRMLAEVVGLPLAEERVADLADAFDGVRVMIAQLEPLAARVGVSVGAPFDAAWDEERGR